MKATSNSINWCMHQAFIKFISSDNGTFAPVLLIYHSKSQFQRDLLLYIRGKSISKFKYMIPVNNKLNTPVILDDMLFGDVNMTFLLSDTVTSGQYFIETSSEVEECKETLFIGVNAGEDWAHVPFIKPYIYLYFGADNTYSLRTTDGSDLKSHVIDRNINAVLPVTGQTVFVEDKFALKTSRFTFTVQSDDSEKKYLFSEDHETKLIKSLGFRLPFDVPMLPEMIRENILLFQHKDQSRFWVGGARCVYREHNGMVTHIFPLRIVTNYHGDRPLLRVFSSDPHGNIYIYGQYQFSEIPEYKCYCQDQYSIVKFIPKLDSIYVARYTEDGKGGIVGKLNMSYHEVPVELESFEKKLAEEVSKKKE